MSKQFHFIKSRGALSPEKFVREQIRLLELGGVWHEYCMSNMSVALVDATFSMDDFSIGGDIADFDFDLDKVFDDYDPEILNSHLTASLDTKTISSSSLPIGSSSSSSDESSLTGVSSIEDGKLHETDPFCQTLLIIDVSSLSIQMFRIHL